MKLASPHWINTLEWDECHPAELILENPDDYMAVINDLSLQNEGQDGQLVFSENNDILSIEKHGLLIRDIWGININQRKLLNAVIRKLNIISQEEHYSEALELVNNMEKFLSSIEQESMLPLVWDNPEDITPILKAMGVQIENAAEPIDRLIDYARLSQEFLNTKLIILVGVREVLSDINFTALCRDFISSGLNLLLIEPVAKPILKIEKRLVIDSDHCELLFR